MSVKHIQKHYEKICAQYIEMRDNLKEMQELESQHAQIIDQIKTT